uniref:PAS domain-containing protein n=1 Tax=Heterorhabditis bacteriophora TaxID=37862 RepID=A0A1I7XCW8_HETBA
MFDAEAFGASEIFPRRPMGLQSPEEVVRSVFENGASHRMSELELSQVLSAVRSALTKGENPVQEESISSSCLSPPPDDRNDLQKFFWFLLSCNGTLQHVSKGCYALLGTSSGELTRRSVFSLVAVRDHHIVPPILHAGPSTSMSCRLHMRAQQGEPVFDLNSGDLSRLTLALLLRSQSVQLQAYLIIFEENENSVNNTQFHRHNSIPDSHAGWQLPLAIKTSLIFPFIVYIFVHTYVCQYSYVIY